MRRHLHTSFIFMSCLAVHSPHIIDLLPSIEASQGLAQLLVDFSFLFFILLFNPHKPLSACVCLLNRPPFSRPRDWALYDGPMSRLLGACAIYPLPTRIPNYLAMPTKKQSVLDVCAPNSTCIELRVPSMLQLPRCRLLALSPQAMILVSVFFFVFFSLPTLPHVAARSQCGT